MVKPGLRVPRPVSARSSSTPPSSTAAVALLWLPPQQLIAELGRFDRGTAAAMSRLCTTSSKVRVER